MLVVSMKQKYFVHYHIVGYVRVKKKKRKKTKQTNQQSNSSDQMGMFSSHVCGNFAWISEFHSYSKTDLF